MNSENNCQFILERLNSLERVVLNKPEHTYTCGRAKANEIVCLSLTVSRHHCIFFHGKNELYVTDLKSSNGLFINGIAQEPFRTTRLSPNDTIGIGCPNIDITDDNMYIYKLRVITQSRVVDNEYSGSTLSETLLNVEHACNKSNAIGERKRVLRYNHAKSVPNKILKLDGDKCLLQRSLSKDKYKITEETDFEIVPIPLDDSKAKSPNNSYDSIEKNVKSNDKSNARKHINTNMFDSRSAVKNLKPETLPDDKTKPVTFRSPANTDLLVPNDKKKNAKKKIPAISKNKRELNTNLLKENQSRTETNMEHSKAAECAVSNFTKYNRKSNSSVEHSDTNVKSHVESNNEMIDTSKNQQKSKETVSGAQTVAESKKKHDAFNSIPNFLQNEDGEIKLEDELQLTDTDEDMIRKSLNLSSVPEVSPLKLKKVEQQPKTKFSEHDVVNISDSEDDVFPCSQLFDIGFGMNTSIKEEIKEEPTETGNERFSILDDADLVISLTDSEDEDNTWLHRLSRSQILNETDEINTKGENSKIKEENMDAKNVDIKESLVDKYSKKNMENEKKGVKRKEVNKEGDTWLRAFQNLCKVRLVDIFAEKLDTVPKNFSEQPREAVDSVTSIGTNVYEFSDYDNLLSKLKGAEVFSNKASNNRTAQSSLVPKKTRSQEKKVPQIEPPHLPNRRRSSSAGVAKFTDKDKNPARQRLSVKEKKEQLQKLKVEQYFRVKEQRNRKALHKWADCLPHSKTKTSNLTKEEKKLLADSRKMKLKKLAMEEKRLSLEDGNAKKRIMSKPKAKVTNKTRTDFLVEETISAFKSDETPEKSKVSSRRSASASTSTVNLKGTEGTKSKNVSKDIAACLQKKLTLIDISNMGKIPKKKNVAKEKENTMEAEEALKNLSLEKKMAESNDTELKSSSSHIELSSRLVEKDQTASLKSNIKRSSTKKKKRVTFSSMIQTVRVYEIDESNIMKKLVGKDAPIPPEKIAVNKPRNISENNAKFNEFLFRIFSWNPVWLEEQAYLNATAPVVRSDELNVMLTCYRSYEEYYKVIAPLLLLEIWYGITKEFQNIDQNYKRPTFMCSIVENSIQTSLSQTNVRFSTLMLEVLVTQEDMQRQALPVYGDLVYFEYVKNHEKKQFFHKVFAYVTNVYTTVLTPLTRYNKELHNYIKNPRTLVTYSVLTRELDKNISVNRVQRFRAVAYLRPSLRMVQALQYLPNSPLVNLIINPKIDMYKLPIVSGSDAMITGDKLNQKQTDAVCKVTKAVVQRDPKLCFIQGPPGTGKSKVIVNTVAQILYGDNRYTSNGSSIRILVCAPSNAAVDEIVLRLLNIRSTIKQEAKLKPFKMVRIGRTEMMHPTVRNISVTELAKRDIKKTAATTNSIPTDSVEDEMLLLDSKMNALKCELANSQNVGDTYKQHLRMKLAEIAAKKELLKNKTPLNEINDRERMKLQRGAENRILEHADIITCTLSSCYTNQMESIFGASKKRISVCIVDEATQSCEAETLIPLMLGVSILVLVGDPNQLPATILSPQAKKLGLDQSIFSRVQSAFDLQPSNPIIMLDTQYRMQPDISSWANKFFYGGKLINAVERNDKFPFHSYRLLNLNTNESNNFVNNAEANFVANIIYCMLTFSNMDSWESCISYGILTPYNDQKSAILSKINEKTSSLPDSIKKKMKIEVNTVDGFQGQERDVIIMSCVRSQGIGFMSDRHRFCVALTRAKHSLIICGNFNIFMRDQMWNSMLSDAKSRRLYFNVNANVDPNEIKSYVVKRMVKK